MKKLVVIIVSFLLLAAGSAFAQKHHSVASDSETAVAEPVYLFGCKTDVSLAVIYADKIVARSLEFVDVKFHIMILLVFRILLP